MNDIDIHHLAAAYALDAVDDRERAAFEAHYPSCEICRTDVIEIRETLALLAAADAAPPPAALKDRLMAEVAQTRQLSPLVPAGAIDLATRRRPRRRAATTLAAAAAAVGVVAVGVVALDGDDTPSYAAGLADVLEQPDGRVLDLDAGDGAAGTSGAVRVAWSQMAGRAVLLADGLPAAADGEAYELWLIDEDGADAMGVLDAAEDGTIREVIDIDDAPAAWGITIEPAGGSDVPTGEILYAADA